MVPSTEMLLSTAGLTEHIKSMPAAGTISYLFYITIFLMDGFSTHRQTL